MAMPLIIRSGSRSIEQSTSCRLLEVRALDWETAFFGAKMGALVITAQPTEDGLVARSNALANGLRNALHEAELDGYRHLSWRVSAHDLSAIWAAEHAGWRLMDIAVDLSFHFGSTEVSPAGDRSVRQASPNDVPAMQSMTRGAFGLTRFATDPFFTAEQVDQFYATWAANLFRGLADHIVVTDIDDRPVGFVSCKLGADGEARIPLVATAGAYQRRGVARDLLSAALAWLAQTGCRVAHVKTQVANSAAVALYERAGFTLSRTELTFTTTLN